MTYGVPILLFSVFVFPVRSAVESFLTLDDFRRSALEENVTHLTDEDFRNAAKYNSLLTDKFPRRGYVLSHQKHFRGDIRGRAQWLSKASHRSRPGVRRNGVVAQIKKWPQGRIPYVLSTQYNERERAVLARAFQEYHRQTCIRFSPKTPYDRDFLFIGKIDGCYSDVGKAGGRQELSLDDGCMQYDTIIHELMHSVGFYHEHERWDRDTFIQILWQNIDREAYDQFGRVDLTESSYYGEPYDYRSILHYDSLAFSKNGGQTLMTRDPTMTRVIGSALDFSPADLVKIQRMYSCSPAAAGAAASDGDRQILTTNQISSSYVPPHVTSPWSPLPFGNPIGNELGISRSHDTEGTQQCSDRSSLCWRWLDRCNSPFFEKIMREFCAASCGFCKPPPPRFNRRSPLYEVPYYYSVG